MNVLFVNATRKWGGEKTWALETAGVLQSRGHRCVMVGRSGNRWVQACRAAGLEARGLWFGPDFNPCTIGRLVGLIRRGKADCLVVNISKDLRAGCAAGALTGTPVVRHVGLAQDLRDTRVERWLYRRCLAGMVVVGHQMKRDLIAGFPWLDPADIGVVHIGKDLRRHTTSRSRRLRESWGLPSGAVLFGVTSQLHPSKGHPVLFEALARAGGRDGGAFLAVAGEGPARAELEAAAHQWGLGRAVRFFGFQSDLPEFLSNLDAFALPSHSEGFPNTLVEAMASGLPCVATRISCVPEIVDDGRNGLLVARRDVSGLADAMAALVADPELRAALGREARRTVEERFRLEDKVSEFETYLTQAVARYRGGRV